MESKELKEEEDKAEIDFLDAAGSPLFSATTFPTDICETVPLIVKAAFMSHENTQVALVASTPSDKLEPKLHPMDSGASTHMHDDSQKFIPITPKKVAISTAEKGAVLW